MIIKGYKQLAPLNSKGNPPSHPDFALMQADSADDALLVIAKNPIFEVTA
jgi:hypothetical protein